MAPAPDLAEMPTGLPVALARPRRVSAVTVTYHTGPVLWANIAAQLAQPELVELILVDNGNPPETRRRLAELAASEPRIRLLNPQRNLGFAAGCNYGAAVAQADYLAFVNPDCELRPGTLAAMLDVFEQQAGAWLCGGRLQHPDGREQRGGRRQIMSPWRTLMEVLRLDRIFPQHPYFRRLNSYDEPAPEGVVEVPTVSGAFMMIPRQYYERLGGMDDHMFLHLDDIDLCIRVGQMGGRVLYAGHVPIPHHLSTSDVSRVFIEWHKSRSASYYFVKHFHASYPRWFLSLVSTLLWLRFGLLFFVRLPGDLPGILRRLLRRD